MKKTMTIIVLVLFTYVLGKTVDACEGVPGIAAEELDVRFAQADKNGDGKLNRTEFAEYLVLMKTLKPVSIVKL
jgi:hypothetical protein